MATEAYVKEHKMEKMVEDLLNCLKDQPENPYTAMAEFLGKSVGEAPKSSGKKQAAAPAPAAGDDTQGDFAAGQMLTPSKLGYTGSEFPKPATADNTYFSADTGMLTETPPAMHSDSKEAGDAPSLELIYFPVMAKGLQLALIAEMSGLAWSGFTVEDEGPKSWAEIKESGIAPFGQMPLLKVGGLRTIGQSCAIANYLAKLAGPKLQGESPKDFAISQMCMAEAEDIFAALGKCELAMWKTVEARKSKEEEAKTLFAETLPAHFANLEKMCTSDVDNDDKHSNCKFSSTGTTAGEIYLFGMIHQCVLAGGQVALHKSRNARGGGLAFYYVKVKTWYEEMLKRDEIQKVLDGDSAIGKLDPYFIDTPTFNKKHGIEDDTGYGEANGYGVVAVDLAAEAAKQKEVMKALRKAQMDKPPPVAMKKDPKTGEMVKFESEALKDDLPEEEAEEGEIEIPVGDDY